MTDGPKYVHTYANPDGFVLHHFAGMAGLRFRTLCGRRFIGWSRDDIPSHGRICKACARKKGEG